MQKPTIEKLQDYLYSISHWGRMEATREIQLLFWYSHIRAQLSRYARSIAFSYITAVIPNLVRPTNQSMIESVGARNNHTNVGFYDAYDRAKTSYSLQTSVFGESNEYDIIVFIWDMTHH